MLVYIGRQHTRLLLVSVALNVFRALDENLILERKKKQKGKIGYKKKVLKEKVVAWQRKQN